MADQIPRPMNKTPPAIRINWSPLPRVTASAPPIAAPHAHGPPAAAPRGQSEPPRALRETPIRTWPSEPESPSVYARIPTVDHRSPPRCRPVRSVEGDRVLPRDRRADVLMENCSQLDP